MEIASTVFSIVLSYQPFTKNRKSNKVAKSNRINFGFISVGFPLSHWANYFSELSEIQRDNDRHCLN